MIEELILNTNNKKVVFNLYDKTKLVEQLKILKKESKDKTKYAELEYKINLDNVIIGLYLTDIVNTARIYLDPELKKDTIYLRMTNSDKYVDLYDYMPIIKATYQKEVPSNSYLKSINKRLGKTYRNINISNSVTLSLAFDANTDKLVKVIIDIVEGIV